MAGHAGAASSPGSGPGPRLLESEVFGTLGGMSFVAAPMRLGPRDQWLGWGDRARGAHIDLVVSQDRFLLLPSLSYGNFGRNVLSSDPVFNADFSLFKLVPLADRRRLEIRFEAFDVFNHIDWAAPGTLVGRAGAGRVSSTSHAPRILEFGIKLHF